MHPLRWFAGPLPRSPGPEPAQWRLLSRAEAEAFGRTREGNAAFQAVLGVALENGHALLVAERDGRIVAQRFVGVGWVYLDSPIWSLVRLPDDLAYFYGIWVEPAYRGRGIGRAGVAAGLEWAGSRGLTSCACWVNRRNTASLRNWYGLGVPWFDATRLVAAYHGAWVPRSPWRRLGVTRVERRPPWTVGR